MNVAIVQEHVHASRGGAETSVVEMAAALAVEGARVTVVHRGPSPDGPAPAGLRYQALPTRGWTRFQQTYHFLQDARQVCRGQQRYDIVHAVTPCLHANVYQPRGGTYPETIARSIAMTSPLWRTIREGGRLFNMRQRFLARIEARLLTRYRDRVWVAALSDYVRHQVETGYQFPAEQLRVVFNGVDVADLDTSPRDSVRQQLRTRLGLAPDTPILLFVAHNFRLKGLAALLAALVAGRPDWHLLIAGRGKPAPYQRQAARLGVTDRTHFVRTDTPVRELYRAADVLAHPTWYDPCSRVVLEALCHGLPVVTTRYNGAAEVMDPDTHGRIIDTPEDIPALTAALVAALEPEVRDRCQADAPQLAAKLSMQRHAQELMQFYEEVLGR